MGKIAAFIGVELGADGKITVGNTKEEYEGLPYDEISEQMADSRSCKREISTMLIKERKKVQERLDSNQLGSRESEIRSLSIEYASLREEFIKFASSNGSPDDYSDLPLGSFNTDTYGDHIKSKLEVMNGKMQGALLLMAFMPTLQEITEGAKNILGALDNVDSQALSEDSGFSDLKHQARNIQQRSQAVLLEMVDLVQNRTQ